jgi:hypothetical protein
VREEDAVVEVGLVATFFLDEEGPVDDFVCFFLVDVDGVPDFSNDLGVIVLLMILLVMGVLKRVENSS